MRIWDISMTVEPEMQVYKNKEEKRPVLSTVRDYSSGSVYESRLSLDLHTGTHIDAPLHIIEGGESIEKTGLSRLVTRCRVLDLTKVQDKITDSDLSGFLINPGDFIILKTSNSSVNEFDPHFVYLSESGARFLKDMEIIGVGIDALGIERNHPDHPAHRMLLGAGIHILEGLRLAEVPEGEYTLVALPLKLKGAEASPVRAVLLEW